MCSCGGGSETLTQIPDDAIALLRQHKARKSDTLGTGMFAIAAPEEGARKIRVLLVPDLSFHDCVERGLMCIASKWIPNLFKSFDEVQKARSERYELNPCEWDRCRGSQGGVCESWECICIGQAWHECE